MRHTRTLLTCALSGALFAAATGAEEANPVADATAVVMKLTGEPPRPKEPVVVKVDRPFFYAVMDGRSRTALFIGRVTDPR